METPEIRTVDVIIRGRVQGVGYRMWTRREAGRLGLAGHVRNRADGSVEARFCGRPDTIDRMLEACRTGPPGSRVNEVAVTDRTDAVVEVGFAIL